MPASTDISSAVPAGAPNQRADPAATVQAAAGALAAETLTGRIHIKETIIIMLAGNVAGRRCLQGSAPGFRVPRSWDARKAYHEAGHTVVRHLFGRRNWGSDIIEIPGVRGGVSWGAPASAPEASAPGPVSLARSDSDIVSAAKLCHCLAFSEVLSAGSSDFTDIWKRSLGIYRKLKAQTRELVETHWQEIGMVAQALLQHQALDGAAIEAVLSRARNITVVYV
jgi:hypothetical protein